jgi:hypothetical protein
MGKGDYAEYVRLIMSYRLCGVSEMARVKCVGCALGIPWDVGKGDVGSK